MCADRSGDRVVLRMRGCLLLAFLHKVSFSGMDGGNAGGCRGCDMSVCQNVNEPNLFLCMYWYTGWMKQIQVAAKSVMKEGR
jgi:hypothetical protein